jgi:DNA repair exonuclease SbcCD ATPase subunit
MKPRYRREVVEEILDIRVFGLMDLILRSQQSDLQKKLTEVRHQCDLIRTKYETEAKYLKSLEAQGNDNQAVKQNKLEDNTRKSAEFETKLQNINEDIDEEFKENKCSHTETKVNELQGGYEKLLEEISKHETKLSEFGVISKKIQDMNMDVARIKTSLEGIKSQSDHIQEELKLVNRSKVDTDSIHKELEQMMLSLKEEEQNLDKVKEEKGYVDVLREILNDKGAKSKIIKKYVPIMNNLINKYLQAMDFFISFNLDEEFNETVKSRFRDTFNYNNFSEGEKMRIDLALLFTWRDIARLKNSTNTNLLILDEIFDSSLDGQGTDDFFKIINSLEKENIFIISHKGDILFDKFKNVVKFEKYKNFTRLQNA